jgi:GTP cyclohydrolase I
MNARAVFTQSDMILARLQALGVAAKANDNISAHLEPGDLAAIERNVADVCERLLDALVIERDHNTRDTPRRMAKMFVREVFHGRYAPAPALADFPNAKQLDELYTLGPITIRSACSHHFVPIIGTAWVGVIPGETVIGISKFNRLTEWIMARPQIQEEAAVQLADALEAVIQPLGLAVLVRAQHMCMTWRGVRENATSMTTSVMRGAFRDNVAAREEFLAIIRGQGA